MRSAGWRSCRLACRNRKVTRCVGCASRYARRRAKPGAAARRQGVQHGERTLNRHFQQQTSLTWSEWVRRAKLMEALIRLAQGHSVLRVALELGYGSHSAFSAMFRRVMGVAPSDYFRPST